MTRAEKDALIMALQSAQDQAYLDEEKFSKDMMREDLTDPDLDFMFGRSLEYSARSTARMLLIRLLIAEEPYELIKKFSEDLLRT
ncbi:MAG: hypothetical protein SR1Q5_03290 [Quinella sp. 1Q5]|nr:hypothetical protein [Quinella sp. 1Q5]